MIGGNSDKQLERLKFFGGQSLPHETFLHVEGPHRLWMKKYKQFYFTLRIAGAREMLDKCLLTDEDDSDGNFSEDF